MFEIVTAGGIVMVPIILCSILAVAITLERLWTLREQRVVPDRAAEEDDPGDESGDEQQSDDPPAQHQRADRHVGVGRTLEHAVEPVVERLERAATITARPEQLRGERGTERQRVHARFRVRSGPGLRGLR